MSEDATTKPTIETVLERVNALGDVVNSLRSETKDFREEIRREFKDFREEVENRLDRIESMTNMTRSEMLTLRMDFREIRAHIKQTA